MKTTHTHAVNRAIAATHGANACALMADALRDLDVTALATRVGISAIDAQVIVHACIDAVSDAAQPHRELAMHAAWLAGDTSPTGDGNWRTPAWAHKPVCECEQMKMRCLYC